MNELKSYTEYAVSTPTADFVIGFDFNYGEDAVNVTVDDVPATAAGYTVVYLNETTIRLSPSVPSGVVRLQRETDIDQTDHAYRAGAKFIAQTMDENFEQLRHSQQEVRDGFSKLSSDTHEIIEGLDAALELAQDAAQDAQDAAVIAQGAADTVNTIIVGGKVGADNVLDSSGETQQQVNYNGGAKWHSRVGGYLENERVVLANGDIVKSTIDGNANDPNVDMTGWKPVYKKTSVSTIVELSTIANPTDSDVVYVESYHAPTNFALAQPYKGGGHRIYIDSRKAENDGFLCINGWVLTGYGNELDTYQTGFADGDLTDHSDKFQAMLNSLPDGTHLKVYGEHRVSTAMLVSNKNDITIEFVDGAALSAKELRDSFIFKGYDGTLNGSGARGILHFHQCSNPKVIRPTIRGCQKHNLNAPEPWEDGDAGVGFSICTNPLVEYGDISHTTAWGIIAELSTNAIAQHNHVYDVLRQSGISITINQGSSGKALYNTIHDVGLYGLEWETYADSFENQSFGNIVYNCLKGEAVVGNVCEITSSLNTYTNCYQGLNSENTNVANSKLVNFNNNTVINCWIGSVFSNAGRVSASGNTMKMQSPPSYYILTAYDTVLSVLNDTQFVALGRSSIVNGDQIKINDSVYTVTGVATSADTTYGSGTIKTVTVNSSLAGVRDMTQIWGIPKDVNSSIYTAGSNTSLDIFDNPISNYAVGFKSDVVDTSNTSKQVVRANSFKNITKLLELNTDDRTLRFYENTLDGAYFDSSVFLPFLSQYIFPKTKKIQVYRSTTLGKTLSFYLPETTAVIAVEILFPSANGTTTGVTVVELDGSQNIATVAAGSLNNTINTVKMYNVMSAGVHTLKILDTAGDLTYGEVIISLLTPV